MKDKLNKRLKERNQRGGNVDDIVDFDEENDDVEEMLSLDNGGSAGNAEEKLDEETTKVSFIKCTLHNCSINHQNLKKVHFILQFAFLPCNGDLK